MRWMTTLSPAETSTRMAASCSAAARAAGSVWNAFASGQLGLRLGIAWCGLQGGKAVAAAAPEEVENLVLDLGVGGFRGLLDGGLANHGGSRLEEQQQRR
jgi:hypothetical protein